MTPESTPHVIPSNKPILVTGAAGFIGFHTARRLLDEGHRVVGLDNLNPCHDPQLKADRLALLEGCRQQGDTLETHADTARLHALTGYEPRVTVEEGIGRFVAWYREYFGKREAGRESLGAPVLSPQFA